MDLFTPLLFIPIVCAALAWPPRRAAAIGAGAVLASIAAGIASGASAAEMVLVASSLAIVSAVCAWRAHAHESQRAALARVSRTDPLTGCLNRRGFEERFEAELDSASRTGRRASLVVLDLDDFKEVNDSRGHDAGDELLRWTVTRAGAVLRPMDSLSRLGGDEFAIIVPGAGRREATEVAARVRDALGERVSASTGVASFPIDGSDRDSLQRSADRGLYAAKHGRAPEAGPTTRELAWAAALGRVVDLRTSVPDENSSVVARFAAGIAQRLGWSGGDLAMLRMAAMLHDVGKVSVPDHILEKSGPLSGDEYERIKTHSTAGAAIVEQVDGFSPIVDWIRHSHEHFDGSGYPDGLSGDEIPMAARIMLVAEAFDAMTSDRPYGTALTPTVALEELRANAGEQFDPGCVAALEDYLAGDAELVAVPA